jgi:hypothetical protein
MSTFGPLVFDENKVGADSVRLVLKELVAAGVIRVRTSSIGTAITLVEAGTA